jgi:hypothetical protein
MLVCRLRPRTPSERWPTPPPTAGEVELENVSDEEIAIEFQLTLLQYLDLHVTNTRGEVVSSWCYSECFSPSETPLTLHLQPGEKAIRPVALLGNVPQDKQTPGRYTIQAIYAYNTIRAVSNPLEIEIGGAMG